MTQTPPALISIVIPHYGDSSIPSALLDALDHQETDRNLEVILVDDASPEPFEDRAGIRVIRRETNGGFGSAVNTGVDEAKGDWILILNSDLTFPSDFVDRLVAGAQTWMPAVVGPRIVDERGNDQHSARRAPRISHLFVEWLIPLARLRTTSYLEHAVGYDLDNSAADRRVDWLVGAALLLPTATFRSVGGFDERFHMNCEEIDLQRRLTDHGVPSVQLGSIVATHAGGASSSDRTNQRRWLLTARRRYAEKWGGLRSMQVALTSASIVNLIWNLGRRLAGRPVDPFAATREELALIWSRRYR